MTTIYAKIATSEKKSFVAVYDYANSRIIIGEQYLDRRDHRADEKDFLDFIEVVFIPIVGRLSPAHTALATLITDILAFSN